jgi:hypothetical protein
MMGQGNGRVEAKTLNNLAEILVPFVQKSWSKITKTITTQVKAKDHQDPKE